MDKVYIVDHNGSYRSAPIDPKNPDDKGHVYHYQKGKPVRLPEDAIKALGESVKPTDKPVPGEKEVKEVKNPFDKMVHKDEAKTK